MATQAAVCPQCGHQVATGARFCQNCGTDVSQEQAQLATMSWNTPGRKTAQETALEMLREETLGEYEILGELGRGGMATVYLAHDIALDRRVAIKVMSPALMDEGLAERFRREARTSASLNHPHIIPIYAVRERSNLLYFVMKFVAGQSLDPIIKTMGQLPIPMAQVILAQAASALGYGHRRGVIHRDVKPANIMLDEDGWVVMTDFGIAKVPTATGLTMTGVTVGTPAYMSPEQCLGHEVTGASDQYSLGVVAYEMLVGRKPFTASTAMAMMYAHFNEEARPLRELRPEIPPELEASVMRMMAKDPAHRWPKIDDAISAPQLRPDDPTRQQLISLVSTSPNATMAAAISTPTSPVPPVRKSTAARTTPLTPVVPPPEPVEGSSSVPAPVIDAPSPTVAASTPGPRLTASPTSPTTPLATATGKRSTKVFGATATPRWPAWLPWAAAGLVAVVVGVLIFKPSSRTGTGVETGGSVVTPNPGGGDSGPSKPSAGTPSGPAGGNVTNPSTAEGNPPTAPEKPPRPATTVARISLRPARLTLDAGKTGTVEAQLQAADGSAIADRSGVKWSSSAPGVAAVDDAGVITGVAAGRARITAVAGEKRASTDVTVRPGTVAPPPANVAAVATVVVEPDSPTITVGRSIILEARLKDGGGAPLSGKQVNWTSSDPGVVSVSTSGQAQGRTPGSAVVTASAEGKSASTVVKVMALPVAAVKLNSPPELKPGQTFQLVATAQDADENPLADRKAATWTSSETRVATVNGTGLVTALAPGTATIAATIEGRSGAATVTVGSTALDAATEQARAAQEINAQLDAFVAALNSLDLSKLKNAYPGMSPGDEEGWRKLMTSPKPERLRATRDPVQVPRVTGDAVEVPFKLHMRPEYSGARAPNLDISYSARFQQEDGKWRLRELQRK